MDGWVRVLRPFNSISVILRRWKGEHERLCAMKRRLGSGRISPPAGFEPATPWSEVGSANRSTTRTLLPTHKKRQKSCCILQILPTFNHCTEEFDYTRVYMHFLRLWCAKTTLHSLKSRSHGRWEEWRHKTAPNSVTHFRSVICCRIEQHWLYRWDVLE